MEQLPEGLWRSQGARKARLGADGVFYVELQRRDGTWAEAAANIDEPSLANFDGVFIPSQSEQRLRQLMPTGTGGLSAQQQTQLGVAGITAAGVIAGALIAAL